MTMFQKVREALTTNEFTTHDKCGVDGCEQDRDEVVELKPFDPIDHGKIIVPLCEDHLSWARERNAVAEEIHQEFRDYRKQLGERYNAEVNQLQTPPSGELDDAASVDQIELVTTIMRGAYSEDGVSIEDVEDEL